MNKQVGSNFAKHQYNLMTMYSEPILVIIDHKKHVSLIFLYMVYTGKMEKEIMLWTVRLGFLPPRPWKLPISP